jgi:hypothetical protein
MRRLSLATQVGDPRGLQSAREISRRHRRVLQRRDCHLHLQHSPQVGDSPSLQCAQTTGLSWGTTGNWVIHVVCNLPEGKY